jgi:hypothetical protein
MAKQIVVKDSIRHYEHVSTRIAWIGAKQLRSNESLKLTDLNDNEIN